MITLGATSIRQDIKSEESVHKPAATWLLVPVAAFYLAVIFAFFRIVAELGPMVSLAIKSTAVSEETSNVEQELKKMEAKIKDHEAMRSYVEKKEAWANNSLGSGALLHKIFSAVPSNVKLRGMTYEYSNLPGQNTPSVKMRFQFRGATETGRISSAIRQIDEKLTMINSRQVVTDQGMELEVEYRIQN